MFQSSWIKSFTVKIMVHSIQPFQGPLPYSLSRSPSEITWTFCNMVNHSFHLYLYVYEIKYYNMNAHQYNAFLEARHIGSRAGVELRTFRSRGAHSDICGNTVTCKRTLLMCKNVEMLVNCKENIPKVPMTGLIVKTDEEELNEEDAKKKPTWWIWWLLWSLNVTNKQILYVPFLLFSILTIKYLNLPIFCWILRIINCNYRRFSYLYNY